jgi:hypothetical protein
MPSLEDAIALAVEAHRGQKDKVGAPYILHPLRVMFRLETEHERMTGILHDVVEDTAVTLETLRGLEYPPEVVAALACVTRRNGESYDEFVDRLLPNPIARRVKLADLEDNMDVRRLPEVTEKDAKRLARYRRVYGRIKAAP